MSIVRRIWSEDTPFDFDGEFFRYEGAFSSVKPVTPDGIPLYFAGASPPAIEVGAAKADVYAFWGEPREAVAARMETIDAGGGQGRADTPLQHLPPADHRRHRGRGLGEGGVDRRRRPPTGSTWPRSGWPDHKETYRGLGGAKNATFSVDRDTGGTTSVGRKRLIEMSADRTSTTSACG